MRRWSAPVVCAKLEARVRDLERLLGRKTLEVEVLKEALSMQLASHYDVARSIHPAHLKDSLAEIVCHQRGHRLFSEAFQ